MIKQLLIQKIIDNDSDTTYADFSSMELNDADVKALVEGLKKNTHLQFLSLFESNIRQGHLKSLYDAIKENTSLKVLQIQKFSDYSRLSISLIDLMQDHLRVSNERKSMPKIRGPL